MLVLSRPRLGLPELKAHLSRGFLESQGREDCDRKRRHALKSLARPSLLPQVYWGHSTGVFPGSKEGGKGREREYEAMPKEEVQETDQIRYRNRDEGDRIEGDRREVKPGYQDQGRMQWWGQESQKQGRPS